MEEFDGRTEIYNTGEVEPPVSEHLPSERPTIRMFSRSDVVLFKCSLIQTFCYPNVPSFERSTLRMLGDSNVLSSERYISCHG